MADMIMFALAFTVGLIIGCIGSRDASSETINKAVTHCSVNGGLKQISTDGNGTTAYCINGAVFEVRGGK